MDSRTKRRSRKRAASVGALIGAAAAAAACATTEGEAPPIDYGASADGTSPVDSSRDASPPLDSARDALTDSTLVDLDNEADGPLDTHAGDAGNGSSHRDAGRPDAEVS